MEFIPSRKHAIPSYEALLLLCCTVSFACYFGSYMRIPVAPVYARLLGADNIRVGLINSSFLLMAGLLSMPLGILSDRMGRKLLILLGLLVSAGTSFLLCFISSTEEMVAVYLLFGMGLAAFAPTMMSFVADFSPPEQLGRSYGWYTMALYVGMSLGPAAGGFWAQLFGFKSVFATSGALIFCVCLAAYFYLPKARYVLVDRPPKREIAKILKELLKNGPLVACWFATLFSCFGLGMFVTFLPLHAQDLGMNMGWIGLIFGVQASANALSRLPLGRLSDRVSKRSDLVSVGLLAFAFSISGFGILHGRAGFILFAAFLGVSMGIAFTSLGALISEIVPPDGRGLAMGGYNTCIYLGMMLSSMIMGAVTRKIGFDAAFIFTGLLNLLVAVLFYLLNRTEGKKIAEPQPS